MAESIGALRVEISASTAQFEASMAKAGNVLGKWTEGQQRSSMAMSRAHDEALKMNGALGKTTSAIGGSLSNLAKMAISLYAIKTAFGFVTDSLKAQSEQVAAVNKLNQALANQGTLTEKTSQSLIGYSSALQEVSKFSDEVILDGMALLASFGLNEEQIKAASKAALDYAAFMGIDLTTAMMTVGKAFAGNAKELGKLGIVINKTGTESERLEQAVTQLEGKFGGAALAATQTYEGGLALLKNQFGEVQESLGKFLGELSGSDAPFGVAIAACKRLAAFLGKDMTIAVSEFRAQWLEMMADLVDPKLQSFMDGFKRGLTGMFAPKQSEDAAAAYRSAAAEVRKLGDESAAAVGKIQPFVNGVRTVAPVSDAAQKALKKLADEAAESAEKMRQFWKDFAHDNAMRALKTAEDAFKESERQANVWSQGVADAFLEADKAAKEFEESVRKALEAISNKQAWDAVEDAEKGLSASAKEAGNLSDALDEINGLLQDFGVSASSALSQLVDGLAGAASGAANLAAGLSSMNPAQIIQGIAGIASAVKGLVQSESGLNRFVGGMLALGPVGGILAAVFGGPSVSAAERLNHELMIMRTEFVNAAGGLFVLEEKAKKAGVSLDAMWNARTVAEYEAAVHRVNAAIALHDEAVEKTKAAMDRWGVSIEQLGPAFAGQLLSEQLLEIYQDFRLLEAAGVDVAELMAGPMGKAIAELVRQAIASGAALPLAMKPWIEELARSGQLLDENGDAITDISQLQFTETLEAGVSRLIDKIEELVNALLGIPPEVGVSVKVHTQHTSSGGGEAPVVPAIGFVKAAMKKVPKFASGGIGDFGAGTLAMLHGREKIVPLDSAWRERGGGGDEAPTVTINLATENDPGRIRMIPDSELRQLQNAIDGGRLRVPARFVVSR